MVQSGVWASVPMANSARVGVKMGQSNYGSFVRVRMDYGDDEADHDSFLRVSPCSFTQKKKR